MEAILIQIHNFRAIIDATVALSSFGSLVGINNSGKSTVIDAIRCFYGDLQFIEKRDAPKSVEKISESWVEISFQLTDAEHESLPDKYKCSDKVLKVRHVLYDSESKKSCGLFGYEDGALSRDNRFYGWKNVASAKLGRIVYIPALSKIEEHTKLSGPSVLRDLIGGLFLDSLSASDEFKTIQENLKGIQSLFDTSDDGENPLDDIRKKISEHIEPWNLGIAFRIDGLSEDTILKSLLNYEIVDEAFESPQPAESYGHGFQRSLIFALINAASEIGEVNDVVKDGEFSPRLSWVLFEEPESFLHPTQIRMLNHSLQRIAARANYQVLISTHNPIFLSNRVEDLTALCRLHKMEGVSRVCQCGSGRLEEVLNKNIDISNAVNDSVSGKKHKLSVDDLTPDMEAIKYSFYLDEKRCEAFFATRVLLVEGPSEVALIAYLRSMQRLVSHHDVAVIDSMGKFNMPRFMMLFEEFGIPHVVLYDKDGHKSGDMKVISDIYVGEIERLAKEHQSSLGTFGFDDDLERFLGVPIGGESRRKPQHILYCCGNQAISDEKLGDFAKVVDDLLAIDTV